jgi:hypothetical protein
MNTLIHLWVEPLVCEHKRCPQGTKVYFNVIVQGKRSLDHEDAMEILDSSLMRMIMDYGDIDSNWDYGVVNVKHTTKPIGIDYGIDVEKQAEELKQKQINKLELKIKRTNAKIKHLLAKDIISGRQELALNKSDFKINEDGTIAVSIKDLETTEIIDFPKLWVDLEKNFIGKIEEGQEITLTDDKGNTIFRLVGGSFLNIALADLHVYDKEKMPENIGIFNRGQGLKGGLYIREDGSIDIGDNDRTFFLSIDTKKLIRAGLKAKQSLTEFTRLKLNSKNEE